MNYELKTLFSCIHYYFSTKPKLSVMQCSRPKSWGTSRTKKVWVLD